MALPEDVYREFARRGHRLLATYLAIHAWVHDLDCVVLDRDELLSFWGIKKNVKTKRQKWLKDDIGQFFPFPLILRHGAGKMASIYLSRRPLPIEACEKMSDEDRIELLKSKKLNLARIKLPSESQMLAVLTSTMHGLSEFPTVDDD